MKTTLFKKPINIGTTLVELQSVQDEMNDFLKNIENFQSQFQELQPEDKERFKITFNKVIDGFGDKLT